MNRSKTQQEYTAVSYSVKYDRKPERVNGTGNRFERSVEALAAETGQPFASVSQHLRMLRRAQLVEARREGT